MVRGDHSQVALGPALETSSSKRGSLKRCPQCCREGATVPSVPPIAREGARNQLQSVIAAFGSYEREAMKRAQRAAQEPPISNQVEEFIVRAEKCFSRPTEVEIGVRFGGWPKPIAVFARSCRGHSADAEPCASGPSRLGCSNPVSSTDGQSVARGARRIDVCHRPESFEVARSLFSPRTRRCSGCKIPQMPRHCG